MLAEDDLEMLQEACNQRGSGATDYGKAFFDRINLAKYAHLLPASIINWMLEMKPELCNSSYEGVSLADKLCSAPSARRSRACNKDVRSVKRSEASSYIAKSICAAQEKIQAMAEEKAAAAARAEEQSGCLQRTIRRIKNFYGGLTPQAG